MTSRTKRNGNDRLEFADEINAVEQSKKKAFPLVGVIYARYSDGGNQTDQSLEGQVRECRKYALENNIKIIEEYLDPHLSGKDAESRPEFQRMIQDSYKHHFNVLIVWKTDRFARNRYDSAKYKERLKRNGVSIRYAAEHIPDSAEGIILESMLEGMAEYYSADLRQKIMRGYRESAYKCKVLSTPPIGYKVGANRQFEIDEDYAPLIRQIFDMYIRGDKLRDIAEKMNGLGLRTRKNNLLRCSSIDKIISNEKYIGVYEYKKAGMRKEDAFPALIPKEIFYQAQERKNAQKKGTYSKRNYGGSAKRVYPLSGLVFCGECGSTMFAETVFKHRGEPNEYHNSYYTCRCRRKGKNGLKCNKKPVPALALEQIVKESLVEIFSNEAPVKVITDAINLLNSEHSHSNLHQVKTLRAERRRKQQAIQNSLKALDEGECIDIILTHLKGLERDLACIDNEIANCQTAKDDTSDRLRWLLKTYQKSPDNPDEYWNDVFHCFINSVTCYENGDILIQINFFSPTPNSRFLRRFESKANLHKYLQQVRERRAMSKTQAHSPRLHKAKKRLKRCVLAVFLYFYGISPFRRFGKSGAVLRRKPRRQAHRRRLTRLHRTGIINPEKRAGPRRRSQGGRGMIQTKNKQFVEQYARQTLHFLGLYERSLLLSSDKPDLQDAANSYGIEVVQDCYPEEREFIRRVLDADHTPFSRLDKKKMAYFRSKNIQLQIISDHVAGAYWNNGHPNTPDHLIATVERKLGKLNQGGYAPFAAYGLYVFVDTVSIDEQYNGYVRAVLRAAASWPGPRRYDTLYLDYHYGLCVCSIPERRFWRRSIDETLREMIFSETQRCFSEKTDSSP